MTVLLQLMRAITRFLNRIRIILAPLHSRIDRRRYRGASHGKNGSGNGESLGDFSRLTPDDIARAIRKAAHQPPPVLMEVLRKLAIAGDSMDPYTRGHSERVTRFAVEIAKDMDLPEDEIDRIRIGALIHDIGKIAIDRTLLSKPGALTAEEYDIMKTHTTLGFEMLKDIPQLKDVTPGLHYHHERLDGKGYPFGLKGDQIPRIARVITVADCFDAMITMRPYQDPAPIERVLAAICTGAGVKYDVQAVESLVRGVRSGRIMPRSEDRK